MGSSSGFSSSTSNYIKITHRCVDGRPAIQMANNDIIKLAKSVSKWAASVAIAKLFDATPPDDVDVVDDDSDHDVDDVLLSRSRAAVEKQQHDIGQQNSSEVESFFFS